MLGNPQGVWVPMLDSSVINALRGFGSPCFLRGFGSPCWTLMQLMPSGGLGPHVGHDILQSNIFNVWYIDL